MPPKTPRLVDRSKAFLEAYTHGLDPDDLPRLFTRDTREAYRFFARNIDEAQLRGLPWHRRWLTRARLFFWAFTLRLSPARRVLFGVALLLCLLGFLQLFRGFSGMEVPHPSFAPGAGSLFVSFLLVNLLVLLEVADRLSLKNDLEIARDIQHAMLPQAKYEAPGFEAYGLTRPANTVGGDFYDALPLSDGRVVVTVGDVAGKGSPAALLMALLLAMFRTLVDEGLETAELAERLNVQVWRHSPASRFITLFVATCDPATGRIEYINAGHTPGLLRRRSGAFEHLTGGGIALGMFDHSKYEAHFARLEPGDTLVLYSDGVTEAEDHHGRPFEETGLEHVVEALAAARPADLAHGILKAVERHASETSLADDLTVLVVARKGEDPAAPCAD